MTLDILVRWSVALSLWFSDTWHMDEMKMWQKQDSSSYICWCHWHRIIFLETYNQFKRVHVLSSHCMLNTWVTHFLSVFPLYSQSVSHPEWINVCKTCLIQKTHHPSLYVWCCQGLAGTVKSRNTGKKLHQFLSTSTAGVLLSAFFYPHFIPVFIAKQSIWLP